MEALTKAGWLILVGFLWGGTNPLMKIGSKGITELPPKSNAIAQFFSELFFLFTRWQYLIPFLINMSGSVVFYWSLSHTDISLVVPITNSLTFLCTTLMSAWLGEGVVTGRALLGVLLVLGGVSVCVSSKL